MTYQRPKPRTKYCGVYAIRHLPSGRVYIGGSTDMTGRWTHHRFMLRRGVHKTSALQELWTRDGEAAFVFEVLERVEKDVLFLAEEKWLADAWDRLNTSPHAVTGKMGTPSEQRQAAARRMWADPAYAARRFEWLHTRTKGGRFVPRDQQPGPQAAREEVG